MAKYVATIQNSLKNTKNIISAMNTKMKKGKKKKLEPRPYLQVLERERNVYPKCKPFLVSANAYVCMVHGALYRHSDTLTLY